MTHPGHAPGRTARSTPPVEPRRSRTPLYALVAALVVIVVQGVVGTVVALADTPADQRQSQQDVPGLPGQRDSADSSKPTPGVPIRDGDLEFVLRAVRCGLPTVPETSDDPYRAEGRYCLVMVTARNVGEGAARLDLEKQRGFQADGTAHTPDAEVTEAASAPVFLEDIAPGKSVTGQLVYDIAIGARLSQVELRGSESSKGVRIPF